MTQSAPEVGRLLPSDQSWGLLVDRVHLDPGDGFLKQMLLVVDGFVLGLPDHYFREMVDRSPELAQPLVDRGLLVNLPPRDWLRPDVAEIVDELAWLALSNWRDPGFSLSDLASTFDELDPNLQSLLTTLKNAVGLAALAGWSGDCLPNAGLSALVAHEVGLHLSRTLDRRSVFPLFPASEGGLAYLEATMAQVVATDMQICGPALGSVPLDEVLDFRSRTRAERLRYLFEVRAFALDLLNTGYPVERAGLRGRRELLALEAREIEREARRAFGHRTVGVALGASAAAWPALNSTADPVSVGIGFAAAAAAWIASNDPEPDSFILLASQELNNSRRST